MSNWREEYEEGSELSAFVAWLGAYYTHITLAGLAAFAFWIRARFWENFIVDGEVLLAANDPWYHLRNVQYTVDNYPATMPFDPWTYFPYGTANGQFGTLFDQIMATMAMVVGLGSPSDELVRMVVLFAPALFGVAVLIPAYLIGRRLGGRPGGVVGAALVALGTGPLFGRSIVGVADHHVAEALFQGIAVLGVMVALSVAEEEKPVWELVTGREVDALRQTVGWGVLGGLAVSLYLWVWAPGVLVVGIVGLFFLIHLSVEYARGRSPEHAAFAGVITMGTAGVLQLGSVDVFDISATSRSLLQPGLALAVAVGCLFIAWLARRWDDSDLSPRLFPAAVFGIVGALAGASALVTPDLFGFFVAQLDRVFGFFTQQAQTAATVVEAQRGSPQIVTDAYQLAAGTAAVGVIILLAKQVLDDEPGGEGLLIVLWTAFMFSATLTQGRFAYYIALPVAATNAALVGLVARNVTPDDTLSIERYQILTIGAVIVLILAPMAMPALAVASGPGSGPGKSVQGWEHSLDWMEENTPAEGQYDNPDGERLEYLGTFARTQDYDHGEGAYGVISWWDYGHWITVLGERIPDANPFQQGATDAARFLLAQNETRAGSVLAEIDEDDAKTRYVMIDSQMVTGKYSAPTRFHPNVSPEDFFAGAVYNKAILESLSQRYQQRNGLSPRAAARRALRAGRVTLRKQPYYESMMVRLYAYHGSSQEVRPYVVDFEPRTAFGRNIAGNPQNSPMFRVFPNVSAAREYARQDGTAQLGGFSVYPRERVAALDHYRLVQMSNVSARPYIRDLSLLRFRQGIRGLSNRSLRRFTSQLRQDFRTSGYTKVFERVPGATIEGTGPAGMNATLTVTMRPRNGAPFQYTKRVEIGQDGQFSTTVPYSTTGYENWGPAQGRTNVSVRALGPYSLSTPFTVNETGSLVRYSATFNVTEAQVIGENTSTVAVDMQTQTLQTGTGSSDGGAEPAPTDDGSDGSTESLSTAPLRAPRPG